MSYKTDQEEFWAGEFGDNYIQRNQGAERIAANLHFFSNALNAARNLGSCIEFGANIGMNLKAIQLLFPNIDPHGIEINNEAAKELSSVIPPANVYSTSILDFEPTAQYDLSLIKGVLIHINPDELNSVYDKLDAVTSRYMLVAEYYNPAPVSISYRGHSDRLFKRDFAGEILERHSQYRLVDYGFVYRRDPNFPQDDITWFLLEK